ncbi:MAG TPA: MauE/DoxX family redox-associated membrane protein [Acidimicrobiales bacterium]|nr:MauE/DoxX family redox-associated membrane protein [Acidimicrobiales bacterium]
MTALIALGVVLLATGAAKLRQPAWPATAAAFGAPGWLAPLLPWVELVLGAFLATGVGHPWTAVAAAGLLVAFSAAVALRLARGQAVPCGCFGETSPEPVGADTLVRNGALLAVAGLAVATGGRPGGALSVVAGVALGLALVAGARARPGMAR